MKITAAERFWPYVVKGPEPEDCWLWTGAVADDGYGRFSVTTNGTRRAVRPHRFAFEQVTGVTLTRDELLMHACDVPICVHAGLGESSHLVYGDRRLNMLDRALKLRHANAASFRWRGLSRAQFAARSRELRNAVLTHGWDATRVRPILLGIDPEAPTLF